MLRKELHDLNQIVCSTVEDSVAAFEKADVRLELTAAPQPVPIVADRTRIAQIVSNLLQNAVKFSARGCRTHIVVTSDETSAIITVADDGSGIAPETIGRLFEPFVQAEQTLARSHGGLGLGLALVKGLVELHGGRVSAQSAGLGHGAAFLVRLSARAHRDEKRPAQSESKSALAQLRVLIVEDNVDAAEALSEVLTLEGNVVQIAQTGPEGLAVARRLRPAARFLRHRLFPKWMGLRWRGAFRADALLKNAYLVALSGYSLPQDIERAELLPDSIAIWRSHQRSRSSGKIIAEVSENLPAR